MYTCAGAVKASVKTVTFTINGSLVLENLVVKRAEEKVYKNKEDEPLWVFEDWWYPGSEGAKGAPLWGLVDDSFDKTPRYNFTRSPHLYLPGTTTLTNNLVDPADMLAAALAPSAALRSLFSGPSAFSVTSRGTFPAYTGEHSFSMMSKWRSLSESAEGAAKILRLVWADILASATVGTNQQVSNKKRSILPSGQRTVIVYSRRIIYDLRYAVPAILLLLLWVTLILVGFVVGVLNRHPLRKLQVLLNDTSVGRHAALAVETSTRGLLRAKSSRWLDGAGYVPLKLAGEPASADPESYQGGASGEGKEGEGEKRRNAQVVRPLMKNDSLKDVSDPGGGTGREAS